MGRIMRSRADRLGPWWIPVLSRAVEDENDILNHVLESSHKAVKRISLDGRSSLSERYAEHGCKLHVHLQLLRGGRHEDAANLCLVFENASVPELGVTERIS